jgi:hypothetical protein
MKVRQALAVYDENGVDVSNVASRLTEHYKARKKARSQLYSGGVSKADIATFEHVFFGLPDNPSRITHSLGKKKKRIR